MRSQTAPGTLRRIDDGRLLKDRAYQILREAIIGLELEPGAALTERRLSEKLGVSKSPIRDALIQLEQEGLVRSTPFKGFEVAALGDRELQHIMQFREAIEIYCVDHFARCWTGAGLSALEATHAEQARLLAAGDVMEAFVRSRFHAILIESLENPSFLFASRVIQAHVRRIQNLATTVAGRIARTHAEHTAILDAVRARDGERAQDLMRRHIQGVLDDALASDAFRQLNVR